MNPLKDLYLEKKLWKFTKLNKVVKFQDMFIGGLIPPIMAGVRDSWPFYCTSIRKTNMYKKV
jgi:hypothetical protein